MSDDVYEAELVRAVASVESAALLVDTSWLDNVDRSVFEDQLAFAAAVIVDDLDGEGTLGDLDSRDDERLREAVVRVAARTDWAERPWAQDLRARLPQRVFDLDEERRRRLAMAGDRDVVYGAPGDAAEVVYSRAAPARQVEAPSRMPTLDTQGPGRFVFHYATRPDGSWLRLVHGRTQALVALVPIMRVGRRWEAHVVLPTTLDVASLVAEPTDEPIVGSSSSVDMMIDAIECGRIAARRSAAGDPAAAAAWRRCARRWSELGDDTRANRAMAYATGNQQVTRPAFVHDAVRTVLE